MKYNEETLKKLEKYKEEIVEPCKVCGGIGYKEPSLYQLTCECMQVFKYVKDLVISGIPSEYWRLNLDELEVPEKIIAPINLFLENFKNAVSLNMGLLFLGANGVGKTALMCEVGKFAVANKYKVKFFSYKTFVDCARSFDRSLEYELEKYDVLLMDEFGKAHHKEGSTFIPAEIEGFIKKTIADKVLIICTNYPTSELKDLLGDSVMSALKRQIKYIVVDGEDYSPKKNSNWLSDLKKGPDWKHPNIMKYARLYT